MKKIIIINGSGGVGKDTFVNLVSKHITTFHTSIVNPVKEIAKLIGWNGEKEEKDRKFLSDIKVLVDQYNDFNYKQMANKMKEFLSNGKDNQLLFIDMREKTQIQRAKEEFGAVTLLITRNSVKHITSNMADAGVFDYYYDYIIENNGTIETFEERAKSFIKMLSNAKTNTENEKNNKANKPKKLIYISHPFGGKDANVTLMVKYIKMLTKIFPDYIFVSPILTFGCLYNYVDYQTGLDMCLRVLSKCDEMWVTGDYKNSKGCLEEINYCVKNNIKYSCFPTEFVTGIFGDIKELLKLL